MQLPPVRLILLLFHGLIFKAPVLRKYLLCIMKRVQQMFLHERCGSIIVSGFVETVDFLMFLLNFLLFFRLLFILVCHNGHLAAHPFGGTDQPAVFAVLIKNKVKLIGIFLPLWGGILTCFDLCNIFLQLFQKGSLIRIFRSIANRQAVQIVVSYGLLRISCSPQS